MILCVVFLWNGRAEWMDNFYCNWNSCHKIRGSAGRDLRSHWFQTLIFKEKQGPDITESSSRSFSLLFCLLIPWEGFSPYVVIYIAAFIYNPIRFLLSLSKNLFLNYASVIKRIWIIVNQNFFFFHLLQWWLNCGGSFKYLLISDFFLTIKLMSDMAMKSRLFTTKHKVYIFFHYIFK